MAADTTWTRAARSVALYVGAKALRLALRVPRWVLVLFGLWVIYHYSVEAMGGREKLWLFEKMEAHRYTAMSMLTGTLRLRDGLSKIGHDEQVYNGAVYTNWGFGVPLLQIPFHYAARKMASLPQKFFPDRAIYFAYFMVLVPVLWASFDKLLRTREVPGDSKVRRLFVSFAATGFVLVFAFYPLMSCRFLIYEETIAYLLVAEFFALCAYIFTLRQKLNVGALVGLGAAAGVGLLIRPTGFVAFGVWALLVVLERRGWRAVATFALAASPFLTFWIVSNWIRSGTLFGFGLNNSMPWFDYHTAMQRFGSVCADTRAHALQTARRLFNVFFWMDPDDTKNWPWLEKCHFTFEDRPPPSGFNYTREPFFGPVVLGALGWMVLHQLRRREWRVAFYLPTAAFVALFGAFVWAGGGFAWRYAGDFWPFIVLAVVQYVRFLPRSVDSALGWPVTFALLAACAGSFERQVRPYVTTLETLDESAAANMWNDFTNSRYVQDKPLASHVKCGERADWLYHNGQGWLGGCKVDTFTNLFVGVPEKSDDHYVFSFKTEGFTPPTLRVYVNGRIYVARRTPEGYAADVNIHFARLTSPIVLATIEWTRDFDPPPYRLLSVELT